jgi:hypothetical protein
MSTCPQCGGPRSSDSKVCRPCYIRNQTQSIEQRFWSHVDRRGPDECWTWTAARDHHGYGIFGIGGHDCRMLHANRIAWILTYGPIPAGLFACHKCDNPPCCNPTHLFLGTNTDNMADMKRKGRDRCEHWGESNGCAKLTQQQVNEIRERRRNGEMTKTLAAEYKINPSHCSEIITGRKWRRPA